MKGQLLNEELKQIASIMGVKPKLINESVGLLRLLVSGGDDIAKFFTKGGAKNVGREIMEKLRSGADNLTAQEIKLILKNLDFSKIAKSLYRTGTSPLPITKSFETTFENSIVNIKKSVESAIEQAKSQNPALSQAEINRITEQTINKAHREILNNWRNGLQPTLDGKAFFNSIQGVDDDIIPLVDEFYNLMEQDFNSYIAKNAPDIFTSIGKLGSSKAAKEELKEIISKLTPNNIETIRRTIFRMTQNSEALQKEFIDVANEMGKELLQGNNTSYYTKKLVDILGQASTKSKKDIENLYEFVYAPKIPAHVRARLSKDQVITQLVESLKKDKQISPVIGRLQQQGRQWRELLPGRLGGLNRTESFWVRWAQFILKGTPETFGEIVATLRRRGLPETLARKTAAGIFAKYTLGPLIAGTFSTIKNMTMELNQLITGLTGWELLFPEGAPGVIEDSWFLNLFRESFKEWSDQEGFGRVWPWRTYIDDLWGLIEIADSQFAQKKKAADAGTNLQTPEERAAELEAGLRQNLVPQDLKNQLPEEYHQFMGLNNSGQVELKNTKLDRTYKFEKVDGEWGIEALNSDSLLVLLPLSNTVLEQLKKEMGGG